MNLNEPTPRQPNREQCMAAFEWLRSIACGDSGIKEDHQFAQDLMMRLVAVESRPADLNRLAVEVHQSNRQWWHDPATGKPIQRNKGELLALIHSEISEALEGERKNLMDDHLPQRRMAEVELVDAIIRILDYAGGFGYDLQGAFDEKMIYNRHRADHQPEARMAENGKKF